MLIIEILTIHKTFCGHKKFGPDQFGVLTFLGYKQTNKQTDRQAKFIYIYILIMELSSCHSDFLISRSLQPNVVNLCYFKPSIMVDRIVYKFKISTFLPSGFKD